MLYDIIYIIGIQPKAFMNIDQAKKQGECRKKVEEKWREEDGSSKRTCSFPRTCDQGEVTQNCGNSRSPTLSGVIKPY